MAVFRELLKLIIKGNEMKLEKGYFSYTFKQLEPVYEEYKQTYSFFELKRKMMEAEKVSYNLYIEDGKDVFSGKVGKDGTLLLGNDQVSFNDGVVKMTIDQETTLIKRDYDLKPKKFFDSRSWISWGSSLTGNLQGPEDIYLSFD